jgi:Polyketide cyclase / dehydrase and lipid transport
MINHKFVGVFKWTALTFAGILILVVAIGAFLPQKHKVSRTVSVHRPVEAVWSLISGPPNWRPDVTSYQELPPQTGHRMWRETDKHNHTITYETIESVPPRLLVTKIADKNLPFGGTWTYEVAPTGTASSTLTITEDGEVYNPLFRFVSRFMIGQTATLDSYLKALNEKLGS